MAKDKKIPFYKKKKIIIPIVSLVTLLVVIAVAFRVSPVPGALLIRTVFEQDAGKKREAMEKVAGAITTVNVTSNLVYIPGDKDALLDVYVPKAATSSQVGLPVVIWTHGGAWLSGDKKDDEPYFKMLADKGFVVVAPNYSLAPSKSYPFQVNQLNQAYSYVNRNIAQFHGDSSKIILAGDSAGSQLSSQLAAIITNPSYAKEMNITPSLRAAQVSAVVLYCGIYKMEGLAEPHESLSRLVSWGNRITVWSYTGTRDANSPLIHQMSAFYHVDSQFPPTFISGGNGDPLTLAQSVPFADKLKSLNVDVETLFYPADHVPSLAHEDQFVLDKDGLANIEMMAQYLKSRTAV